MGELNILDVGTSPGEWDSTGAFALWNASKVILANGYISFHDFHKLVKSDSNVKSTLSKSNIFLLRKDVKRIYFQSRIVEDYMRSEFDMPPRSGDPTCATYD